MSRTLALALVLGAVAGPAAAQVATDREAVRLLSRAESLQARLERRDSLGRKQRYQERLARRFDAGDVTAILANSVGDATGHRVVAGASAFLSELGAIPPSFISSCVVVAYSATGKDSVLRAEGLIRRARIMADALSSPDTLADGAIVAVVIGRAYRESLDADWKAWLPEDVALVWTMKRDGAAAAQELMAGETDAGARCLAGDVARCRLWLGVDRDPTPYATRYRPAEIRRLLMKQFYGWGRVGGLPAECAAGSDRACLQVVDRGEWLSPVPASPRARAALVREVRALHGAATLRRALTDSSGSVGARLARAVGISEDSLIYEWRSWVLTGGGNARVAAGARDAMPALIFAGLLLLAAARSGRWR
ncbi:MAG: hypothetical protein ABSG61_03195 [Gemmatimonadales bacterium]|jgi:hypothetical protein